MSAITLKEINSQNQMDLTDLRYLEKAHDLCKKINVLATDWFILVNVQTQKIHLLRQSKWVCSYPISTAAKGIGQESGSSQTPLGLHEVDEKIGAGADLYAIFDSRQDTGKKTNPEDEKAYIVSRILWLKGLEKGYNQGNNLKGVMVDSKERYIYIHGTNHINQIGIPVSSGCIRMHPENIVELFDQIPAKTLVYIYNV